MYRLLAIIALINSLPKTDASTCSTYSTTCTNFLTSLSNDIMNVDNKLKDVCKHFLTSLPRETVDQSGYKLEYDLPGFSGNFDVRIKHRLLGIIGHDPQQKVCDKTYVDIRALPDYVNGHEATWYYEYSTLTIQIPFRFKLTEVHTRCGFRIDESLIHVRKGYGSPSYDYYG